MTFASRLARGCGLLLLGLAVAGCGERARPPHVLLVTIDTCRADRIGAYDARATWTPVLDALAASGTVFEDATAPAPITLPSHASILTGLYPDRHGVRDNGKGRLPDEAETLGELLAAAGWRTGAFLAAVPLERRYGTAQGFERYDDEFAPEVRGDLMNRLYDAQRTADAVVDATLPWLREALAGPDPVFAWVHFFDPHSPLTPPDRIARRVHSPYDAEVAFVDEEIGRLLDGLGEERDRFVVLVTADHGESLDEHDESSHGFFVYDATVRVPWILAGPGIPAGRRVAEPVSLVQVLPTLLDLVGVDVPADLDGASARPLLAGAAGEPTPIYAEALFPRLNFGWAGTRSLRRGSWKYIEAPRPELYDLAADPQELRNVIDERPDVAAELAEELRRFAARGGELSTIPLEIDEETRRRLDALGYVGGDGLAADDALWDRSARDPKDMIGLYHELNLLPGVVMESPREREREFVAALLAQDPDNVAILEKVLKLRRRRRDHEGTVTVARRLLDLAPDHGEAWSALAGAAAEIGEPAAAAEAYGEAIRRLPDDAGLAVDHALALEALGETDSALAEWSRALALVPDLAPAVNGKALLLVRTGRERDAVEVLRAALPALPEDVDTLNNLAWILADASLDADEAYRIAARARELAPDDPVVLDTFGWAAIRSGRPADAVAPLEAAWRATGDAEVRAHLGVALAESGRTDEGAAHARAAVAERPALADAPEVARWAR